MFLGVIALATFTMAAIQVGVIVYGWALARRVNRLLAQVEQEMKPLAESLNTIARDAARISSAGRRPGRARRPPGDRPHDPRRADRQRPSRMPF